MILLLQINICTAAVFSVIQPVPLSMADKCFTSPTKYNYTPQLYKFALVKYLTGLQNTLYIVGFVEMLSLQEVTFIQI